MGNISTCEPVQQKPLINTEQSLDFSGFDIEQKIEYSNMRNKISEAKMRKNSIIEHSIEEKLLLEDDLDFDYSELFYCWVTSDFKDKNPNEPVDEWKFNKASNDWKFTFKLHIFDKFKKGYYKFSTTYTKIQQIYSAAYACKATRKYFPTSRFSEKFREDHKNDKQLELMEKYMVLYDVLWADQSKSATQNDVQTCCDVLIKLLNAPLFIQKKSNILFALDMKKALKMKKLLQYIAREYIVSLSDGAKKKGFYGNDFKSQLWKVTKWSHLTFHTVSLVERANNNVSNHWGIKFEGNNYILSLDWFNKDAVYYQIVKNNAIGHKIAWYSWIRQTQFVHHWNERIRISNKNWNLENANEITFYEIGRLVNMWKLIIDNKYRVFDNNCQHFARDLLSVFAVNAAKVLTDNTQNIFISANMTLKTELDRVDQISKKLKKQLKEDYDTIKNDKIFLWLKRVGLPQYYYIFKAQNITIDMLRGGLHSEDKTMMEYIIIDEKHRQRILQQIPECPNNILKEKNNWNQVKSLLNSLHLYNSSQVIATFKENGIIDIDALCDLNEKDLKEEMKIVLGNRNKILKTIKKLQMRRNNV